MIPGLHMVDSGIGGAGRGIKLTEDLLFDFEFLQRAFLHVVGVAHRLGEGGRGGDARHHSRRRLGDQTNPIQFLQAL